MPDNQNEEESAFQTWDEMSDLQTSSVISQLLGEGFEWGLSSSDSHTTASEELCTFEEAMASPDAPKWLAACRDELSSIKNLGVFKLVPRSAAEGHTVMKGHFVFRLKCDKTGKVI